VKNNSPIEKSAAVQIAETLFPALCHAVVVRPSELDITVRHLSKSSTVSVEPPKTLTGSLIGRGGSRIKAFTLLARLVGDKHGWPVVFNISTEPGQNPKPAHHEIEELLSLDKGYVVKLLESTLTSFLHLPFKVSVEKSQSLLAFEVVIDPNEPPIKRSREALAIINKDHADKTFDGIEEGDEAIQTMLNALFVGVGVLRGCVIKITYMRPQEGRIPQDDPQPTSADGRYVRAEPRE
jgi:predicted RNA-binding protein YlqC (UPF0109 family)